MASFGAAPRFLFLCPSAPLSLYFFTPLSLCPSCRQACAPQGGDGATRAFEALCLLLHEPQLKASVPVTCVSVVSAFVSSPTSSSQVVLAALDLLAILHMRMQVCLLVSCYHTHTDHPASLSPLCL